MKILLIFPPQWTPVSPHFAIPSLVGQLRANGFDAQALDLNIDFYNKILDPDYIRDAIKKGVEHYGKILSEVAPFIKKGLTFTQYPLKVQNKMVKYSTIKDYVNNKEKLFKTIPSAVNEAMETVKGEKFYNPEELIRSIGVLDTALELASFPYLPSKLSLDNYTNPFFKLSLESIKYFVFDKDTNIFIDYYKTVIDDIKAQGAKYIGISINSSSQIIPGLTLANLIKKETDAHINIGGNFFGRVVDAIVKNPEFFDLFCDTVSVEEGEGPVVELAKYVNGEIPVEEVSNLLYKKEGKILATKMKKPLKLDEMHTVSMEGYKKEQYFAPEIIMPFQSSRGCYWGKCSFCDQDFGQNFNVKNVEKLTNEFIEIKEKYGIKYFEFIDESVSPAYLGELSQKLKEKNIDIKYFFDARLESTFSYELLKKAHETGLTMVLWGLESGSREVMELINKGIDIDRRLEILKNSSDAGIWNFAFIFFGFPTETMADAQKTIDLICNNTDLVHSYGRSVFTMGKHTKLKEEAEKYGITAVYPSDDEFSPTYTFDCIGMKKQELSEMIKKCTQSCAEAYGGPLWMFLRYREYLFLYLAKFGAQWVKDYKIT